MFNNAVLIGRLTDKPTLRTLDDGTKVSNFTLAVLRPFRNQAGDFDTDFLPISLWYSTAQNAHQYCNKGDLVCVKGRLVQKVQQINDVNYHSIELIGERIIFLSSKNKEENFIDVNSMETEA